MYYGTVDATPLWVCLLHDAWKWGMPADEVERLLAPMRALPDVADRPGLPLAHGFVSYIDESGQGLANQGWKDSSGRRAVSRRPNRQCPAGSLRGPGVRLRGGHGRRRTARRVRSGRGRPLARVRGRAGGAVPSPVLGRGQPRRLPGDRAGGRTGPPVDSLSSNIGHLLGTGLLSGPESELVAQRLGSSDLNSWVRPQDSGRSSAGFNPLSYHCGSVWAHDTAIAIAGLARTSGASAREALVSLVDGLLYAAEGFGYRLPELYGGHARGDLSVPLPYPASCHPQAWAAASSIAVLAALLGIQPDVPRGTVELSPVVADSLLTSATGLRVGGSEVAVHVNRDGEIRLSGGPKGTRVVV